MRDGWIGEGGYDVRENGRQGLLSFCFSVPISIIASQTNTVNAYCSETRVTFIASIMGTRFEWGERRGEVIVSRGERGGWGEGGVIV